VMGGVTFMMHGAGWMAGGLHASYEKMVIDAELLQMVSAFLDGIPVDDDSLAISAIGEVGPGGHFFGVGHTQARFRNAFHHPMISDWRNYETWEEAGRPEAPSKAQRIVRELLDAYEPPALDDARREELEAFVARRVSEGGVPTDF
jgi:trimethylamine---corrinoid protein Co-methyltransferase